MTSIQNPIPPAPETLETNAEASKARTLSLILLARVAVGALMLVTIALFCAGIPARVNELANLPETTRSGLAQIGLSIELYVLYNILFEITLFLGYTAVALFITWKKADDLFALAISLSLVLFGASFPPVVDALGMQPGWRLPVDLLIGLALGYNLVPFFLFPSGRFVPRWTKWLVVVWVAWNIIWPFVPGANPFQWSPLLYVVLYGGAYGIGVAAQVYRYLRVSNHVQKQQTKWLVFGDIVAFIGLFGYRLLPVIFPNLAEPGVPAIEYGLVRTIFFTFSGLLIPLTFAIAILRYRLWDIDLIINRTLVYVPLTAILAGLFAASITLSQKLFIALTGQQSDAATVLTTLVIVAAFTPLKERLQVLVDRRFKGAPESIRRLQAFEEHVRARVSGVEPQQITRRLLEEAVMAFAAKSGAAYLERDGELKLIDTMGEWQGKAIIHVPLQAEEHAMQLGLLELGERDKGSDYTPKEREALEEVASIVAQAIERDTQKL